MNQKGRTIGKAEIAGPMMPLAEASALAPRFYVDPQIYALEAERIFADSWISIGRVDQVAKPGDYFVHEVAGERVVAVRDHDGRMRVMSAICRHRAMPVVAGAGNANSFQCPYHRWTYALDGRLLGAPEMDRAASFDRSQCRLPEIRAEIWEGWIFVNLNSDAPPLAPQLEPLRRAIANYGIADWRTTEPTLYDSPWNWKVMVDNFMESYHHAGIHADTLQPLVPASGTYADDCDGPYAILHNPTKGRAPMPTVLPVSPALTLEQRSEFVVVAIFPFHLFSISPDSMQYYQIQPLAVDRLTLRIFNCVPPESRLPEYSGTTDAIRDFVNSVHLQDIVACEGVQAGYRSRLARAGRYSHLEKALWQFHRYVLARLTDQEK
jgi:phenylpropionate dioxygenase-like ring-hydroxylating dioxygenase large terminal subunit